MPEVAGKVTASTAVRRDSRSRVAASVDQYQGRYYSFLRAHGSSRARGGAWASVPVAQVPPPLLGARCRPFLRPDRIDRQTTTPPTIRTSERLPIWLTGLRVGIRRADSVWR